MDPTVVRLQIHHAERPDGAVARMDGRERADPHPQTHSRAHKHRACIHGQGARSHGDAAKGHVISDHARAHAAARNDRTMNEQLPDNFTT
eukprot:5874697-Pleurochrysis_carterae.AAC.2